MSAPADDNDDTDDPTSPKKLRSNTALPFHNSNCFVCLTKKKRGAGQLTAFATKKAEATVLRALQTTKDKTLKSRLLGVDLIASEVKYHKNCYRRFLRNSDPSTSNDVLEEQDDHYKAVFEAIKADLTDGRVFLATEIVKKYYQVSKDQQTLI